MRKIKLKNKNLNLQKEFKAIITKNQKTTKINFKLKWYNSLKLNSKFS